MKKDTIFIGITGASGCGKTLLSNTIVDEVGSKEVAVISEDAYYKDFSHLPLDERKKINYDHPDSLDHPLIADHLEKLASGESIDIPIHDYTNYVRAKETITIAQQRIVIFEGILLFVDPNVRKKFDIRIYMDTPLELCLIRRIQRDTAERGRSLPTVLKQFEHNAIPMYLQFIEPTKRYADIIVPNGGQNRIAIDLIKAKIRETL